MLSFCVDAQYFSMGNGRTYPRIGKRKFPNQNEINFDIQKSAEQMLKQNEGHNFMLYKPSLFHMGFFQIEKILK